MKNTYIIYRRDESGGIERMPDANLASGSLMLTDAELLASYPHRERLLGWPEGEVFWAADIGPTTGVACRVPKGRKPLPEGAGKEARIEVRCHEADKAALQAKADAAGLSLSAWLVKTGLSARK